MQRQEYLCQDKNIYAKKNLPKHENKKSISQKTTVFCDILFCAFFSTNFACKDKAKKLYMQIFLLYFSFLFPLLFAFCINISHNDIFMKPLPQRDCGRFFAQKYISQKTVVFYGIYFFAFCPCKIADNKDNSAADQHAVINSAAAKRPLTC